MLILINWNGSELHDESWIKVKKEHTPEAQRTAKLQKDQEHDRVYMYIKP